MKKEHVRIFFLLLSFLFIYIGLSKGEALSLLNKAITICLECIGIG